MTSAISIPLWTDLLAVAVGGLQGAMLAGELRTRRLDLLGVAIVGTATGLGGGLLRDIFLGVPAVALSTDWYLPVAVVASLIGMLLQQVFSKVDWAVTALDALTIGLFGAIGASKALSLGLPVIPSIFIGVVSAVGGGVVRDVLLGVPIALMHVGSLYAVAAGAGTVLLVALERLGAPIEVAATTCVVATTLIRILAVRFGWSLPEQRALARLGFPRRPR
ncbi:trimeric intracellular cation channel family protein [Herbiconiux sp. L3-i23]|uniref:trimeric intracellular cation channel family protein n=1 Tax=Herbiconiux sp. L3-i23 TaxID=2905871 RepID=UPI0020615296|nr:TRIC cation channel family protein [Herbiconiux sp. L3-i23]BDI23060.1 UPF0126 membrane protein [Herbiconiux sp. L3-i23]